MTQVEELIERLRFELRDWNGSNRFTFVEVNALTIKASADALASLQDRVARLEEALEPFANMADANMHDPLAKWLRVGHIKDAAAVLQTKAQEISE
jgi:hypothetical protein